MKMTVYRQSEEKNQSENRSSRAARAIPSIADDRPVNALEMLKRRLVEEQLSAVTDLELIRRLHRAADDSASLAWATPYPLLAFPELLAEKVREARSQFERQRRILSGRTAITTLAA